MKAKMHQIRSPDLLAGFVPKGTGRRKECNPVIKWRRGKRKGEGGEERARREVGDLTWLEDFLTWK